MWLLKNPGHYYRNAVEAISAWRAEWDQAEQEAQDARSTEERARRGISSGGSGRGGVDRHDDPREVAGVWADLDEGEKAILIAAYRVLLGCRTSSVSLDALARYAYDFEEWIRETDEAHLRECDDPSCEAAICREARSRRTSRAVEREGARHACIAPHPDRQDQAATAD
jgi:hypothetical protein